MMNSHGWGPSAYRRSGALAASRCPLANHFSLLIIELCPRPETDIPRLQLIPLASVEILEFHVQQTVTPQRLGVGTDVGWLNRELITHRQLMATGMNLEVALVGGGLVIDFQRLQRCIFLLRIQVDPRLGGIMAR
ncbi:hypothetical protein D3C85_1510730 [compost metagenome]